MEKKITKLTDCVTGFDQKSTDWKKYETSFRRWLVSEVELGEMTIEQAKERFLLPARFKEKFKIWQLRYSSKIHVALQAMTDEELIDFKKLQERIQDLEKQLEAAQIKNVLTETMIDIAEEMLKIDIRKKSGPKQ